MVQGNGRVALNAVLGVVACGKAGEHGALDEHKVGKPCPGVVVSDKHLE